MKRVVWAVSLLSSVAVADDDLYNLAEAIYFEARSEPLVCQYVVAKSILNRVDQARFPNTVRGVVHQKGWSKKHQKYVCQYSYFCDGKSDDMTNYKAEKVSYQVASAVLHGDVPDFSNGADHYYAHNLASPDWKGKLTDKFTCNNHTFGQLEW